MPRYGPFVSKFRRQMRAAGYELPDRRSRRRFARKAAAPKTGSFRTGTMTAVQTSDQKIPWARFLLRAPCPVKTFRQCTFSLGGQLTTTATTAFGAPQSFYINSIYHCDGTNNVDGFAFLQKMYRYFKVHAIDVELEFSDPSGDDVYVCALIRGQGETLTLAGASTTVTTGYAFPNLHMAHLPTSGSRMCRWNKHIPIADVYGWTKTQYANEMYWTQGVLTSGSEAIPQSFCSMEIAAGLREAATAATCNFQVRLTYHVQLMGRLADIV